MKQFISKIFGLDRLYDRPTALAILIDLIFKLLFVFLIFNILLSVSWISESLRTTILYLTSLFFLGAFSRDLVHYLVVRNRLKSRSYTLPINDKFTSGFSSSALNTELNFVDNTEYITTDSKFAIFDSRFDFYRKTKHGSYKAKESYYTVIEYKLSRELPHLMFDSRHAKGRQFKLWFVGSQRLELEGNFGKHFELYTPKFYHIDTLSFITPDVMQAMIDNSNYDIEIKGSSLFVFAPLLRSDQIREFENKTFRLYEELNHNLKSYRDDRLNKLIGREKVTDFGASLLKNPNKYLAQILLSGSIFLIALYRGLNFSREILYSPSFIFCCLYFVLYIFIYVSLVIKNKKAEEKFTQTYHFK